MRRFPMATFGVAIGLMSALLLSAGCQTGHNQAPMAPQTGRSAVSQAATTPATDEVRPSKLPPTTTPDQPAPEPATFFRDVYFADAAHGWVASSACAGWLDHCQGSVDRTTDGGQTWQRVALPAATDPSQLTFAGRDQGWVVGTSTEGCAGNACATLLLATDDGGSTWGVRYRPENGVRLGTVQFLDARHGLLITGKQSDCHAVTGCTNHNQLSATADGGRTWRPVPTGDFFPLASDFIAPDQGWITAWRCSSETRCHLAIVATSDGGAHWTEQLATPDLYTINGGPLTVTFLNAREGWATLPDPGGGSMGGAWGALYHTTDGGKTWTLLQPFMRWNFQPAMVGLPGWPGQPQFVSPQAGWIPASGGAGSGRGGVAHTADGGKTWSRGGDDWNVAGFAAVSGTEAWATVTLRGNSQVSSLVHTTDGGTTWTQVLPVQQSPTATGK